MRLPNSAAGFDSQFGAEALAEPAVHLQALSGPAAGGQKVDEGRVHGFVEGVLLREGADGRQRTARGACPQCGVREVHDRLPDVVLGGPDQRIGAVELRDPREDRPSAQPHRRLQRPAARHGGGEGARLLGEVAELAKVHAHRGGRQQVAVGVVDRRLPVVPATVLPQPFAEAGHPDVDRLPAGRLGAVPPYQAGEPRRRQRFPLRQQQRPEQALQDPGARRLEPDAGHTDLQRAQNAKVHTPRGHLPPITPAGSCFSESRRHLRARCRVRPMPSHSRSLP